MYAWATVDVKFVGGGGLQVLLETHRAAGQLDVFVGLELAAQKSSIEWAESSRWIAILVKCMHMWPADQTGPS